MNPHGDDHLVCCQYCKEFKQMSIAVMIENGGRGSGVSSMIAKEVFSLFQIKTGIRYLCSTEFLI